MGIWLHRQGFCTRTIHYGYNWRNILVEMIKVRKWFPHSFCKLREIRGFVENSNTCYSNFSGISLLFGIQSMFSPIKYLQRCFQNIRECNSYKNNCIRRKRDSPTLKLSPLHMQLWDAKEIKWCHLILRGHKPSLQMQ